MCGRWIAAAILLLSAHLSCLLASECPRGQGCTPCGNQPSSGFQIFCGRNKTLSGPHFRVEYRVEADELNDVLEIKCVDGPEWSDFHLGSEATMEPASVISFVECDLPAHSQLASIVSQLLDGTATDADNNPEQSPPPIHELRFNSYGNLRSALAGTTLAGLTNSRSVDLSHNGLQSVPEDLFRDFIDLRMLNLGFNNLHEISSKFLNLSTLQTLVFQGNSIQIIEKATFTDVPSLETLDLSKNRITKIDDYSFNGLNKLRVLNLSENDLTVLSWMLFSYLENLTQLNLSYNNFSSDSLPDNLLRSNEKLEQLDLSHNKKNLTTIPKKFLSTTILLKTLKLNNNGISYLPNDLLLGARRVHTLILSDNNLVVLPNDLFNGHWIMTTIDVSRNNITFVSSNLFKFLLLLDELNLSDNKIEFVAEDAFGFAVRIKKMNFSNNRLTINESSAAQHQRMNESVTTYPRGLYAHEELNYESNNISVIRSDWLLSKSIEVLRLRNNRLTHLSHLHLCFHSLKTVQLDLRDNKIVSIDLSGLDSPEFNLSPFKDRNSPVVSLQLANNPIECDCRMYHLLRHHEQRMSPTVQRLFDISLEGLRCAEPPELFNTPVTSLSSKLLHCRVRQNSPDGRICPDACDCFFRVEDHAFLVNCSHRGFIQPLVEFNPGTSWHTELNLSANSLKTIPAMNSRAFKNVTVLSLSSNEISDLWLRDLSENLTELYLHGNNLTRLDKQVIEFLDASTKLNSLTLHGNPWICDCDTLDFFNFIQTKQSKYLELQRVTCNSSDIPIFKMTSTDICPPSVVMIAGTSLTAIIVLVTVILVALYYRYETGIKMWLFAHRLLPWFVNEAELDRDKIYDAFVSYSYQDESFVMNELVPKLEKGLHKYKLCIHIRDWLPGELIGTQIERSVAESRRTIVVLSRNFLESVWGRMEFRTAHSTALKEGRTRVIVIIYGDIGPIDELEPELASYMHTNTYVQWGDRWFWEKLRYALPHPVNYSKKIANHSKTTLM